jgi:hypothetical protein
MQHHANTLFQNVSTAILSHNTMHINEATTASFDPIGDTIRHYLVAVAYRALIYDQYHKRYQCLQ